MCELTILLLSGYSAASMVTLETLCGMPISESSFLVKAREKPFACSSCTFLISKAVLILFNSYFLYKETLCLPADSHKLQVSAYHLFYDLSTNCPYS